MKRPVLLIAAGAAAFLLFMVALLPASMLLRFVPAEVQVHGLSGTVWRGAAAEVLYRGRSLGPVQWRSRPWRLALLELEYHLALRPAGGEAEGDVSVSPGARVRLRNLRGRLPVATFDGLFAPPGWTGEAEFDVAGLTIVGGYPVDAEGVVVARQLTAPGQSATRIGSFELTLGEGAVGGEGISGRLRNLEEDGPLKVRATLALKPDGSYLLTGEAAPGPAASPSVERSLAFLGPPDSLGRRSFTIEGTL